MLCSLARPESCVILQRKIVVIFNLGFHYARRFIYSSRYGHVILMKGSRVENRPGLRTVIKETKIGCITGGRLKAHHYLKKILYIKITELQLRRETSMSKIGMSRPTPFITTTVQTPSGMLLSCRQ
jgi:hypothetical protein